MTAILTIAIIALAITTAFLLNDNVSLRSSLQASVTKLKEAQANEQTLRDREHMLIKQLLPGKIFYQNFGAMRKGTDNAKVTDEYQHRDIKNMCVTHNTPFHGEVGVVTMPVKVMFLWSDRIVADHDSESDSIPEYTSGYIMKILPEEIVYQGQEIMHHHSVSISQNP